MTACADLELCKLPGKLLGEKDGHGCRGSCGGRLHGICGEPEDVEADTEMHRICTPCLAKKQKAADSSKQSTKRASPASGFLKAGAAAKKKPPAAKGTRTRLDFSQKLEIIKLLDSKVTYSEIERRYNCSTSAIGLIKRERKKLEEQGELVEALAADAKEIFDERVANTYVEEDSISDDELEPDNTKDSGSAGGGGMKAPQLAELPALFGPLEEYAESCGVSEAGHFLRKAKMAFFAAHAARPTRQSDIRAFTQS